MNAVERASLKAIVVQLENALGNVDTRVSLPWRTVSACSAKLRALLEAGEK